MTKQEFCKTIDHAILWQNNSREVVESGAARWSSTGSLAFAAIRARSPLHASIIGDAAGVCAVVGYPMGANTTQTKVFEALDALDNGANEIDVVMNISRFKDGFYDYVLDELKRVVNACKAKKPDCIVKVIIESPASQGLVRNLPRPANSVIASGADYVKQATGYATGNFGYTDEVVNADVNVGTDCVRAIHEIVGNRIKIKNAGCPRDLDECLYYIKELGVYRIGHNHIPEWLEAAGEAYWDDK